MDDQFNFDINLDFLNGEANGDPEENPPANPNQQSVNNQPVPFMNIESIASKISCVDDLVVQFKGLKEEHANLQKQTKKLNESAMSIQSMYEKEKAERERHASLCENLQQRCNTAEAQLANKTLLLEQVSSQVEQSSEKGPIPYTELALRYQRLAIQLDEDKHLYAKERPTLQQIQEYIQVKKLTALSAYKKKLPAKKQVREIGTQYSQTTETKTQSTQCAEVTTKPAIHSQGVQCSKESKSISTNTTQHEAPQKEMRTQGTQYISSMTTRSTSTSTFIKQQSVGTNFPENIPISIEDILKEMIVDITPIDPIQENSADDMQRVHKPLMISVGTSTGLKNIRKPIDYVSASIKRSNSRPPSRNMCDRIKNESPFTGMPPNNNPFAGIPLPPMQNTVAELWNMLGQTLFALSQNTNPSFNAVNSNLVSSRVTNVATNIQREHQEFVSDQPDPEMSYFDENSRSINLRGMVNSNETKETHNCISEHNMSSGRRSTATSPTRPVELNNSILYKGVRYVPAFEAEKGFHLRQNLRPSTRTVCTSPIKTIEINTRKRTATESMVEASSFSSRASTAWNTPLDPTFANENNSTNIILHEAQVFNVGDKQQSVKNLFVKPSAFATIDRSFIDIDSDGIQPQPSTSLSVSQEKVERTASHQSTTADSEAITLGTSPLSSIMKRKTPSEVVHEKSSIILDRRAITVPQAQVNNNQNTSVPNLPDFQKVLLSPKPQKSECNSSGGPGKRKRTVKTRSKSKIQTSSSPKPPIAPTTPARIQLSANWEKEFFGSDSEMSLSPERDQPKAAKEDISVSKDDNSSIKDIPSKPHSGMEQKGRFFNPYLQNGMYVELPDESIPLLGKAKRRITNVPKNRSRSSSISPFLPPDAPRTPQTDLEPLNQSNDLPCPPAQEHDVEESPAESSSEEDFTLISSAIEQDIPSSPGRIDSQAACLQPLDLSNSDCTSHIPESTGSEPSQDTQLCDDENLDRTGSDDQMDSPINDCRSISDDSENDLLIDCPQSDSDESTNSQNHSQENDEELEGLMDANESTFQSFLNNVLETEFIPERPVSVIAPSECGSEQSFTSPPRVLKPKTRKRKANSSDVEIENTKKRVAPETTNARMSSSGISLLNVAGIQLGKYTKKTDEPNEMLKQLQKFTKRKANETQMLVEFTKETPSPQQDRNEEIKTEIRLGFFKDVLEELDTPPAEEEITNTLDCETDNSSSTQQLEIDSEEATTPAQNDCDIVAIVVPSNDELPVKAIPSPPLRLQETTTETTPPIRFEECPASPPPFEQKPDADCEAIPCDDTIVQVPSLLSGFLANYSTERQKAILAAFRTNQKAITRVQNIIKEITDNSFTPDELKSKIDDILATTTCSRHISIAFLEILKNISRPQAELDYPAPDLYLSLPLRRLLNFCEVLLPRQPDLKESLKKEVDKILFTFTKEQRELSLDSVLNFTQFYLALIADPTTPTNPARLFIYKSLYCYNQKAVPMVYEALCIYPAVLPRKNSVRYNRSNALVNTIQCVLMNTWYNLDKPDLKTKKILTKLRVFYGYETFKPTRDEIIENLMEKIKANRFKHVALSFALLCKKIDQPVIEADVLKKRLLPLAMQYLHTLKETTEHDEKIVCILDCISLIIRPFRLATNIKLYRNIFREFLYTCERQPIQEAAVQAILRTERFGIRACFSALYHFRPHYQLSELTLVMIDTFIYRNRIRNLRALKKEIYSFDPRFL